MRMPIDLGMEGELYDVRLDDYDESVYFRLDLDLEAPSEDPVECRRLSSRDG